MSSWWATAGTATDRTVWREAVEREQPRIQLLTNREATAVSMTTKSVGRVRGKRDEEEV